MAVNQREMRGVTAHQVFEVLRDARSYGSWVVGTRNIRAADAHWPEPGARLHYTVGWGPLSKNDETEVHECVPDKRLVLEAHAWPAGSAIIDIELADVDNGVQVRMSEQPHAGLAKSLHNPLLDSVIWVRNIETLRRLERQARQVS